MTAAKPAPMAAFCFASGIIDPTNITSNAPAANPSTAAVKRAPTRREMAYPPIVASAQTMVTIRPSEDDRTRLLARRFHVGGRTDRLRQIRNEDRNEERDAHSFTAGKPDPQHCLFRYPVQQGAQ